MEIIVVFRMIAGEFISLDDAEVTKWIDLAKPYVSSKRFGLFYPNAVALYAAHLMKLNIPSDDTVSPSHAVLIKSYKEGETAVEFNNSQRDNPGTDGDLVLTVYGVQFKSLRDSLAIGIMNSGQRL